MPQIVIARSGKTTPEMEAIARDEGVKINLVKRRVAKGEVVVLKSELSQAKPVGIGKGLRTKVNANVGTSPDFVDLRLEARKARIALKYGADTVMDLSIGGDLDKIRRTLRGVVRAPLGTVPVYQAAIEACERKGSIEDMSEDDLFNTIKRHVEDGVDFITVHCGVTKSMVKLLRKKPRLMGMVSRGGVILANWILKNDKENPLYEGFDYLLDLVKEADVVLSLGDGMRPGCIFDAMDSFQLGELRVMAKLVKKAREIGVQTMVEGPGHLPMDKIETSVQLAKSLCDGAPLYVLGPLVEDVAPGYDHIVAAIGGAMAAVAGADFLCYVTPSEHLGIPLVSDVKRGVIASRIAAHAADLVKLGARVGRWDLEMDKARAELDWKRQIDLAMDPETAGEIYDRVETKVKGVCSMCGRWCAIKMGWLYRRKPHTAT